MLSLHTGTGACLTAWNAGAIAVNAKAVNTKDFGAEISRAEGFVYVDVAGVELIDASSTGASFYLLSSAWPWGLIVLVGELANSGLSSSDHHIQVQHGLL